MASLVSRLSRLGLARIKARNFGFSTMVQAETFGDGGVEAVLRWEDKHHQQATYQDSNQKSEAIQYQIGKNVSGKEKVKFLLSTLSELNDSKEAVYGTLDAWVAWEQKFPIASLKFVLSSLEKEQQWHRVVQVIKWMLSKGQGNTMGTYVQLIRALDMDHRAEEAHMIWKKKIGNDLHSVSWQLCKQMISVYYRNKMLEHLIKLFRSLEAFDRKPPEKSIVRKVADAYEVLGMLEDKERLLQKYSALLTSDNKKGPKRFKNAPSKKIKK